MSFLFDKKNLICYIEINCGRVLMGFLDIFRRKNKTQMEGNESRSARIERELRNIILNYYGGDYKYFVWNYANQIYNIPEVRTAIEKIASIFSRIPIYHKRVDKNGKVMYFESSSTSRVLNYRANALQNKTQFFKETVTDLLLENNAFIEPIFDYTGNLKALYPLPTRNFQLSLNDSATKGYVQFYDAYNRVDKKYDLDNLIYLNRFSTFSGGKKNELGLYETVLKSLGEQIVNVASPNKPRAIIQSDIAGQGNLKNADRKGATEDIKAGFAENIHGLAYLDKMWKITPINWNENDVNEKIMNLVIKIVYNYFGINEKIINDTATEIEMQMFIANTIEPLARQFEEEFTNKLFTENEFYYGNRIEFDFYALTVSTLQAKTSLFGVAIRQGILNIDECREMIGQPPLPNGLGRKYRVTADTVDIEIADEYQLGKVGKSVKETTKTENVSHGTNEEGGTEETVSTTTTVEDINKKKEAQ